MVTNNKYELRSSEVQEVMNRPLRSFITWGNTLILTIIVIGVYLLSFISIPIKVRIPIKVLCVTHKVILHKLKNTTPHLRANQKIEIALDSYPENIYGKISTTIASINQEQIVINNTSDTINSTNHNLIVIVPSMTGYAEITTNQTNIFSELFDHIAVMQK